jgi:hypothetical protein
MKRGIRKKRLELFQTGLIVILLLIVTAYENFGAEDQLIRFDFKPGKTYKYQLTTTSESEVKTAVTEFNHASEAKTINFSIEPIDFQNNSFIVDIISKQGTLRRYLKPNGQISGAPAEAGKNQPFFLIFPDQPLSHNKKHQTQTTIKIGNQQIPTAWNLLLKSIDTDKRTAEIWIAASAALLEDRLRKKKFNLKGKLYFDLELGTIRQADWNTEYSFSLINREMAVTRPVWNIVQKSGYSLKLTGVGNQQ